MQQPPQNQAAPGGGYQPHGWGAPPGGPKPTKLSPAVIAGAIAGGFVVLLILAGLLRSAATRQRKRCDAELQQAVAQLAKNDPTATRAAIESARTVCKSYRAADIATLEAEAEKREVIARAEAARPLLLAAGYKPEQLSRATMLPVCKAKNRMPVEMVAPGMTGEPHYWDCDRDVLYQESPQTPASCEARKLEFTTVLDEEGKRVGACKMSAEAKEAERLRAACKVPKGAEIHAADATEVQVLCQTTVRSHLKSPSSAEFPGLMDSDSKPTSIDGCTTVYASWVDARNSFGAKIRTKYVCTYDPRTGIATPLMQ
ncbi:MAG: hypothetical protein KC492_22050 [Myxococcales bacterium]|nr:hypothetical protein [Myxococcales bacterium]